MASDIEIVNISNFEKIQNFLNDSAYKEILENSENFNTRLCIERRLRMPFLDPQTGVAQTHCALFMKQKQRMPGFRDGQIYTYPSARWRKPKRQYLLHHHQSYKAYQFREIQTSHSHSTHSSSSHTSSSQHHHGTHHGSQGESTAPIAATDGNSMSASGDNDSKDSHPNPEKEWFYEDLEMTHVEDFEEDFESDIDFEESYNSRKRKRPKSSRKAPSNIEATPKRGRKGGGTGGGRRKAAGEGVATDKRRGGGVVSAAAASTAPAAVNANNSNASSSGSGTSASGGIATSVTTAPVVTNTNSSALPINTTATNAATVTGAVCGSTIPTAAASDESVQLVPPTVTEKCLPSADVTDTPELSPKKDVKNKMRADREVAQPSPYCDFCLGDARENKKTNLPEELVSCSDCGRSGHPTCLQFTPNMIISVKRYRWQCIECKYCSICGTSDNDDQLLFCDDCDRGYHMYCLSPPLITPPEGSWSCKLCLDEFHGGDK